MILHLYFARRFAMSFLLITAVLFTLIFLVGLLDEARSSYAQTATFGQLAIMALLNTPQSVFLNCAAPDVRPPREVAVFVFEERRARDIPMLSQCDV